MRLFVAFFALGFGVAQASEVEAYGRSAVVIGIAQPQATVPALRSAEDDTLGLAAVLSGAAGYEKVSILIGAQASASAILVAVTEAVAATADDGTLLLVFVGHGAGGDYGEPALLTAGASVAQAEETGLSIGALASAARPRTPEQSVVIIIDAAHGGDVDGVALIGPSASDWPGIPDWGLAVTTKARGTVGAAGRIVPALRDGLAGQADINQDGHVTISELSGFLKRRADAVDGLALERRGAVAANLVMGDASMRVSLPTPLPPVSVVPIPPPSLEPASPAGLRPLPVTVLAVGIASSLSSAVMYFAKRQGCEDIEGSFTCGDDLEYRRFRSTQHTLGWVGGALVATGVGLQLMPGPKQTTVGIVGTF